MHRSAFAALGLAAALLPLAAHADTVPADLAAANQSLVHATSYRATVSGNKGTTVAEVIRPDRNRITLTGEVIVRVGNTVWDQLKGGAWKVVSTKGPGDIVVFSKIALPAGALVKRVGDAPDGSGPAHVYEVRDPSAGEPMLVWYVRLSDGLVHQIIGPGAGNTKMTLTLDEYNAVPPIEPPIH